MLNTGTFLLLHSLGYGFVLALGWLCIPDPSGAALGPAVRNRLHQLATGLGLVGVIHPVLSLAGRDVAVSSVEVMAPSMHGAGLPFA